VRDLGLVHHTDAVREYAYDRDSKIGKLDKALDEAIAKGWSVVDMKNDWKVIFPFEKTEVTGVRHEKSRGDIYDGRLCVAYAA
jgi:hypothetical protein